MTDKRTKIVHDMAGTDTVDAEAYRTIAQAFRQIADGSIDTGASMGTGADFWVTIAGIEYFVTATRSKKQQRKDGPDLSDDPDAAMYGFNRAASSEAQKRGDRR